MNLYLEIFIRTLIALAVLAIMTRLLGVKSIGQMTSFDYIVSIVIGNLGGTLCLETDIPLWAALFSMAVIIVIAYLLSFLNRKTILVRRYFVGTPTVLINQGEIMQEALKHVQYNINDLLRDLRNQGYFNIADVEYAVMEDTGMLSVLPKSNKRPLTPEDMEMTPPGNVLVSNVIIDGKILLGNLTAMNRTLNWLYTELSNQDKAIENILLATLDREGNLSVYVRNTKSERRTLME